MSDWSPITLEQLWDEVLRGEANLSPQARRLWELVRIEFGKWQQHPWGDLGKGFWVVGLIGNQVLWYNDIEDGFNWSRYMKYGVIDEYWCNQDELHRAINCLQLGLDGQQLPGRFGPPEPLPRADA